MADIALTAAQIGVVFPAKAEIFDFIANAAITAGQAVYQLSTGKVGVADANDSGKEQFRGIALHNASAGQAVSVLKKGHCYGFTLTSLNRDVPLYLSNTAGALADSAGSLSVVCGRVVSLTDSNLTKVLYVEADWLRTWA